MKIKNFLAMMLMAACFVACSSDDDGPSPAQSVAGSYKGYVIMDSPMSGTQGAQVDQTITITANEDGTAAVNYTSSTLGNTTISAATVTATTNGYAISGTGVSVMGMSGAASNYECKLTGTISTDKSDVEIVFTIAEVMGGATITFNNGDAADNLIVAGSYNGTIDMSVMGASQGSFDIRVTIKSQEDGKVEITLPPFGEGSMAFTEDVVMKDIELAVEEGTYTLTGDVNTTSTTTRPIDVTGSLTGTVKDGKANIVFTLTPGAMPMPLILTFASK